jgi:hypothetical protein
MKQFLIHHELSSPEVAHGRFFNRNASEWSSIKIQRNQFSMPPPSGVAGQLPTKDDAINYAQARARFRAGEIRVLDSSGNVERTICVQRIGAKAVTRCPTGPRNHPQSVLSPVIAM